VSHQFSPAPNPDVQVPGVPIAQQGENVRAAFMNRVYMTLLLGIAAFIGMQYVLFITGAAAGDHRDRDPDELAADPRRLHAGLLDGHAHELGRDDPGQGLGRLPAADRRQRAAVRHAPVDRANATPELEGTITTAAWISILAFAGLSAIAMFTGKDFSFLRSILMWGGVLALCLIVGSVLFGAQLGTWFAVAMIGFAGAAILYDTQKVYRSFPPGTEVVAAMHLFSSLALLFWYVLQVLMRR
jgi:uncharacterized protein